MSDRNVRQVNKATAKAAILVGFLILAIPLAAIGHSAAYAQGNSTAHDDKGANDNNNNHPARNNSENGRNHTSSGSSNMSQGEEHRQYGNNTSTGAMNGGSSSHSKAEDKRMQYGSKTAKERHDEHLAMHGPIVGPYNANMNYTLTAEGNATPVSDNSTSTNASISLELSVWKSTKGLVSMDIMKGTIHIGSNETIPIHNGHAYYLIHNHQFRVLGFITDTSAMSNSNARSNATISSTGLKTLTLIAGGDKTEGNVLPTSSSGTPLQISILSPQSKLASEWFLKMSGGVKLG